MTHLPASGRVKSKLSPVSKSHGMLLETIVTNGKRIINKPRHFSSWRFFTQRTNILRVPELDIFENTNVQVSKLRESTLGKVEPATVRAAFTVVANSNLNRLALVPKTHLVTALERRVGAHSSNKVIVRRSITTASRV